MNFKPKKWQIILGVIILLLAILNPSLKDFRDYTGDRNEGTRKINFLIASVYKEEDDYFVGFLLNFIKINKQKSETEIRDSEPEFDSSRADGPVTFTPDTLFLKQYPTKKGGDKREKDPLVLNSTDSVYIRH